MDDNQKPQDTTKEPATEPVQEETPVVETTQDAPQEEAKPVEPETASEIESTPTIEEPAVSTTNVQNEETAPDTETAEVKSETNEQVTEPSDQNETTNEPNAAVTDAQPEETTDEATEEPTEEPGEPVQPKPSKSDNPNAKWYVVHTYSGHENKVAATLKQRIESEGLEKKILDILVPTQDKIEIRSGKKQTIKEKVFPGYILVKMDLDDISWLAVRTTQGVTSFVGIGNKPTPISDSEVQTIVRFTKEEAPSYKQVFAVSDTVKIVDGPFAEFIGKVDAVDEEKGKIRVLVSIFGRETPVELDFLQVQKI